MKGQLAITKTYSDHSIYRHIEIRVCDDPNRYSSDDVTITFQSDNDRAEHKYCDWYAISIEVRAHNLDTMKRAASIAKTLTADEYGGFYQTPAACVEALERAGYKQAIRTAVNYGGGLRDVHYFQTGDYYGAHIPDWGYCYVPNGKTTGAAIAAITEQVLDHYGSKSRIAAWAQDGFPMTRVEVQPVDLARLFDPNTLDC